MKLPSNKGENFCAPPPCKNQQLVHLIPRSDIRCNNHTTIFDSAPLLKSKIFCTSPHFALFQPALLIIIDHSPNIQNIKLTNTSCHFSWVMQTKAHQLQQHMCYLVLGINETLFIAKCYTCNHCINVVHMVITHVYNCYKCITMFG